MKKIIVIVMALTLALGCVLGFVGCGAQKVAVGVQAGTTCEAFVKGDADWGFPGIPNAKVSS